MSPSLRRLAVAGCVLSAGFVAPACLGAVDGFTQPIQNLLKINLLQTVTHISNGLGKKDVEPRTISRTDKWRFVMAEAATVRPLRNYDPIQTKDYFELTAISPSFTREARLDCITGENMTQAEKIWAGKPMPDVGMACLKLLQLTADEQRDIAPLPAGKTKRDPARDLLAPYREIQKMKGIVGTDETARHLIDAVSDAAAKNPAVRDSNQSVPFTLYSNQKQPFYVSAGIAFDATFAKRVLEFIETGALPPKPSISRPILDEMTRVCYDPKGTSTSGQCSTAANGQSFYYLAPTVISSNQTRQR